MGLDEEGSLGQGGWAAFAPDAAAAGLPRLRHADAAASDTCAQGLPPLAPLHALLPLLVTLLVQASIVYQV